MPGGGLLCSVSCHMLMGCVGWTHARWRTALFPVSSCKMFVDGLREMDTCLVEDCSVPCLLLSHVDGLRGMDICLVEDCFVLSLLLSHVDGLSGMDTCQVEDCSVPCLLVSHVDGLRGMDTCLVEDCFVLSLLLSHADGQPVSIHAEGNVTLQTACNKSSFGGGRNATW